MLTAKPFVNSGVVNHGKAEIIQNWESTFMDIRPFLEMFSVLYSDIAKEKKTAPQYMAVFLNRISVGFIAQRFFFVTGDWQRLTQHDSVLWFTRASISLQHNCILGD